MWFRIGKWIELGVHFGSPNKSGEAPGRYLIHARVRWRESEWHHGPVRIHETVHRDATLGTIPQRPVYFRATLEPVASPHLWR